MTSKAVERAITLLDVLVSAPHGLDRNQIRHRVPQYSQASSEAAFERMFERDKDVLRSVGLDLISHRVQHSEVGFTYRVETGDRPSLTLGPIDVLLLSHLSTAWQGTSLERYASSAMLKVGAQAGLKMGELLGNTPRFSDEIGLVECLEATAEEKGLSFLYGTSAQVRKISCWGLGLRFGHWYVYGWDRDRRAERIFRLDRMSGTKILAASSFPAPPDFSMQEALSRVGFAELPLVASLPLKHIHSSEACTELPSYSPLESAERAVLNGATHELTEQQLASVNVDRGQQSLVIEAERNLRTALDQAPEETPGALPHDLVWKPVSAQRERETASQQLTRTFIMLSLISSRGGMALSDLSDYFDLAPSKIRSNLEAVAASVTFGALFITIDSDDWVTVDGKVEMTGGAPLTAVETATLLLAINLNHSSEQQLMLDSLAIKLSENSAQTQHFCHRFSVYSNDTVDVFQEAIASKVPLELTYSSYHGVSQRTVEPLSLVNRDGPRYLRAWCRSAQDIRHFRLDRIGAVHALTNDAFQSEPVDDTDSSLHSWRHQLVNQPHREATLVVPAHLPATPRAKTQWILEQYASHIAQQAGNHFYKLPLVNEMWLFELIISLGGCAQLLQPSDVRRRFQLRLAGKEEDS